MNIEIKHHCQLYASRHVDRYTIIREDGEVFSFNDCSIEGVSSGTISRAVAFLGGYSLEGLSFRCGGPGYGFKGVHPRTKATTNAEKIRTTFPGMPEKSIVEVACRMEDTVNDHVENAVAAHVRHTQTKYEKLLEDMSREEARKAVQAKVTETLTEWRAKVA